MISLRKGYHRHHIIPRYMGGSDAADNIIVVPHGCHIMFHYCNYQLWGNIEDYIAYRGLSGCLTKDEFKKEKRRLLAKKYYDEGVGIAGMTPEQRTAAGKKGGKNSRTFLLNSIWINNGVVNKRVLKNLAIPPGFVRGRKKSKKAIERENRQKKKNPYNKGVPKPYLWLYKRPLPEVLHQMVWDRPMIAIAKEIGCSDNAIRKWCKFNDIPYPSRGFWNKIANNKLEGQTCPLFVNKIRSNL